MKTIRVAAAILCDTLACPKRILATARGYGEYKGQWEFPGGKLEPGESSKEALIREIREELKVEMQVGELVDRLEYDYPAFHLSMDCFLCEAREGRLELVEAQEARWLGAEELHSVDWLPADKLLLDKLEAILRASL